MKKNKKTESFFDEVKLNLIKSIANLENNKNTIQLFQLKGYVDCLKDLNNKDLNNKE